MSNFNGAARSNYFLVKDLDAFKAWAAELPLEVWTKDDGTVAIASNDGDDGCFPSSRYDEDEEEDEDFDLAAELATYLQDGQVAVLMEAGAEKLRYISGWAVAVHSDGRMVQVTLNDIYELASKTFGVEPTNATY